MEASLKSSLPLDGQFKVKRTSGKEARRTESWDTPGMWCWSQMQLSQGQGRGMLGRGAGFKSPTSSPALLRTDGNAYPQCGKSSG